jgi:predicted phosphoribosyltransferase
MAEGRLFRDRGHAGRVLAGRLRHLAGRPDVIVLGLPRGGVPVAAEIARALGVPLDVFVVRKLGVPGHEELAMGAIASGGVRVLNDDVIEEVGIDDALIARAAAAELEELSRRERAYRGERGPVDVRGKVVVLVDDGLATGATMRAALAALASQAPARLVAAVPVGAPDACAGLRDVAEDVVCALQPYGLHAIGLAYDDFEQLSDDDVRSVLAAHAGREPATVAGGAASRSRDGADV